MKKWRWRDCYSVLALLLLAGTCIIVAYQRSTGFTLHLEDGSAVANVHLTGFYAPEKSGTFAFRWSRPQAQVHLAIWPEQSLLLDISMAGPPGQGEQAVPVTITVAQAVLARIPVQPLEPKRPQPYHYTFLLDPASTASGGLTVGLTSPTFKPGGADSRELGLVVDGLVFLRLPGPGWPVLGPTFWLQAILLLIYILVRWAGGPNRMALVLAGNVLILLAIPLLTNPAAIIPYLPTMVLAILGIWLGFLLVRLIIRDRIRLREQSRSRGTAAAQISEVAPLDMAEPRPVRLRRDALAVGLLLVVILLFFYRVVFFDKIFWNGDITDFFKPTRVILADALQHLDLSTVIWNPYIYAGFPLLAEGQIGALYPLNWLVLFFLSGYTGYQVLVIGHYCLAAVFTYLYARSIAINRGGAVLSALAFSFGGFMLTHLGHMSLMNAAIWLPLIFFLAERWVQKRRYTDLLLCGLVVGVQFCAGHPQGPMMTWLALAVYLPFRALNLYRDRWRQFGLALLAVLGIVLLGLAVAAAQAIPTWELIRQSARANGIADYGVAVVFSMPLEFLITLVFPFFFGGPWGYWGPPHLSELALYAGLLPLILALVALLLRRRNALVLFFILLVVLSVLLAMGQYTPVFWLFHQVPLLSGFRGPSRFVFLVDFGLAMLGGIGLTALFAPGNRPKKRLLSRLGMALLVLLPLVLGLNLVQNVAHAQGQTVEQLLQRHGFPWEGVAGMLIPFFSDFYSIAPYILLLSAALILILAGRGRRTSWAQWLCLVLTSVDLFMFAQPLTGPVIVEPTQPLADPNVPVVQLLKTRGQMSRVFNFYKTYFSNAPAAQGIYCFDGYSPLEIQRQQIYESIIWAQDFDSFYFSAASIHYIADYTGTRLDDPAKKAGWRLILERGQTKVYENEAAMPRAFVVHAAETVQDPVAVLVWKSFVPTTTVLLEKGFDTSLLAQAGPDRVEITDYTPMRVVVRAELGGGGFLVLNDVNYPGWQAFVDDQPSEIYQANYIFRAVYLPAGRHTVEFVYRPLSLYVGSAISLTTLAIIAGFLIKAGLDARRSRAAARERT
jgi:hypothetical protein